MAATEIGELRNPCSTKDHRRLHAGSLAKLPRQCDDRLCWLVVTFLHYDCASKRVTPHPREDQPPVQAAAAFGPSKYPN
jgi:hypothetical protein